MWSEKGRENRKLVRGNEHGGKGARGEGGEIERGKMTKRKYGHGTKS